ncbi:MAG: hypothetical protein JW846_00045 [Dehalococcoidia bacterium]|nr:hypothetical protein [Dehalococcoidia bacterium]
MARRRVKKDSAENGGNFYVRALSEAERPQLLEAAGVEGIDGEISLLRIRLRELVEQSPERIDMQMDLATAIARLVKTRYHISSQQKKSLKTAVTRVLEEVAVPLGIGIGAGVGGTLKS